jgi:hypothetical protein
MMRVTVRLLAFVVVAVLVLGMAPVFAQDKVVSTPDSPMALTADWVELQPGETHIYRFHSVSDADKYGGGGKTEEIKFFTMPENGARMTLRNAEQIRKWGNEGKNEWFGMATPLKLTFEANCDRFNKKGSGGVYDHECHDAEGGRIWNGAGYANWKATMAAPGDYWLVVQAAPGQTGAVSYKIVPVGSAFQFFTGQ